MNSPKDNNHLKQVLSHRERIRNLGQESNPLFVLYEQLEASPLKHTRRKFTRVLEDNLRSAEYSRALRGNEPAPPKPIDGSIPIGRITSTGEPFYVSMKKAWHWLYMGASGFGKTNLAHVVMRVLLNRIPCTFMDAKDESRRLIPQIEDSVYIPVTGQRWNILAGAGDQGDYIRYLSSLLAKVLGLRPDTANAVRAKLLSFCSDRSNLPALSELPAIFRKLAIREARSGLHTASRGFEDLTACMGRWADVRTGSWPFDHRLNIVALKDLPPVFEYLFISLLFKHLTDLASQRGHTTDLSHAIIFDEALSYLGKENGGSGSAKAAQVAEMLRLARSYGVVFFAGVQSYAQVHDSVRDNAPVFLTFRANSMEEAKAASDRLLMDRSRSSDIMTLKPGEAFIITPDIGQAVRIKVPYIDLGDYPGETEIVQRMAPLWGQWDNETVFAPTKVKEEDTIDFREILGEKPSITQSAEAPVKSRSTEPAQTTPSPVQKPTDPQILSEYFELLRSCKAHPEFGAASHYKSLSWSAGRGGRVKSTLIELGWIEAVRVVSPKGGRPRETLNILPKGLEALDEHS